MPTDLELIEEQHQMVPCSSLLAGGTCVACPGKAYPCDVVKLARALDDIRRRSIGLVAAGVQGHLSVVNRVERTLRKVAGDD